MFNYIVFVTISVLISYSNSKSIRSLENEPKRCCWTKQFSADASISISLQLPGGTTHKTVGLYSLVYDEDRGLIGTKGGSVTGPDVGEVWTWVIQNLKDKKVYTIDEASKTCSVSPLVAFPSQCIPEKASYVGSNTTKLGDKTIITDTWLVENEGTFIYSTVSRDGLCIPLKGEVSAPQTGLISSQTITNFVPKIKDRKIIDIPKECFNTN